MVQKLQPFKDFGMCREHHVGCPAGKTLFKDCFKNVFFFLVRKLFLKNAPKAFFSINQIKMFYYHLKMFLSTWAYTLIVLLRHGCWRSLRKIPPNFKQNVPPQIKVFCQACKTMHVTCANHKVSSLPTSSCIFIVSCTWST